MRGACLFRGLSSSRGPSPSRENGRRGRAWETIHHDATTETARELDPRGGSLGREGASPDDRVLEEVRLRLGKFRYAYTPQRADGKPAPTIEMAWHILLNRGTFAEKPPMVGTPTPKAPPPPMERFSVKVVDEAGRPLPNLSLRFSSSQETEGLCTNNSGIANHVGRADLDTTVAIASAKQVTDALARRPAAPPVDQGGPRVVTQILADSMPSAPVAPGQTTTLVIAKPVTETNDFEIVAYDGYGGVLPGLELAFDVDGRGPSATTDDTGTARLTGATNSSGTVVVANYDALVEALKPRWTSPPGQADRAVVEDAVEVRAKPKMEPIAITAGKPMRIVFTRKVVRVRLIGMHFDHSKTFLLPSALTGIRKLVEVYQEHPDANLLIVGHTDTRHSDDARAGERFNRQLSLDRAKAVAAFLRDDVEPWYAWYDVSGDRQWGKTEDRAMLSNVPPGGEPYYREGDNYEAAVKNYQANHGLPVTGNVAERTRHALIRDYMKADGTTLPEGTEITVHGCGPYFPEVASGDDEDVAANRRVEIFVFEGPIVPPPTGEISEEGSSEYPAWVAQVGETIDFSTRHKRIFLQFVDDEGVDLGELDYRLEVDDGSVFEDTSPNATVDHNVSDAATSAKLYLNDATIDITIGVG